MAKKNKAKSGKSGKSKSDKGSKPKRSTKPKTAKTKSSKHKLFPKGSKYPLVLLYERCQKNGWQRPEVDARKYGNGWTFAVSLSRINKITYRKETVRLEPYPPYPRPTSQEARHWGATYALYRFCNGMPLDRVLPPGPREYWYELAVQHQGAPENQRWMYDADPFTAWKEAGGRQAGAAGLQGDLSPEFAHAPEVKMSSTLCDLVENTVRRASVFCPSHDTMPLVLAEAHVPMVTQQLWQLGFRQDQIQHTISYLSAYTPLGSHLLGSLRPLDACIKYLVLHVPETHLPRRLFSSNNSFNSTIVSGYSESSNPEKQKIQDLMVREAGFPAHLVKEHMDDPDLAEDLVLLVSTLSCKLIGKDAGELFTASAELESSCYAIRDETDEAEALSAHFVDPCHMVIPFFSAPLQLHVIFSPDTDDDEPLPAIYIGSRSVPAYIRLHLLAWLLCATEREGFIEPEEGFLTAAMRVLEDHWSWIETNGPPDMSTAVGHLIAPQFVPRVPDVSCGGANDNEIRRDTSRAPRNISDSRSNDQVKQDFDNMRRTRSYAKMLVSRRRLPAFLEKDQFLDSLDKHRVVIVVGETGCGKTTQLPQFMLDSLIESGHGSNASIIVTQPRRISAISVAARVSAERADDGSAAYAIRGESNQTRLTKLLYCTTGVLLRRLGSGDRLEGVTYVVVDEVHERSVDSDFLLLELRELLSEHDSLKVVLMSATINHEKFAEYFDYAPVLTIPGLTYPIVEGYLEDFIDLIPYAPKSKRSAKVQDKEYEDELRSQGLSERGVSSIQGIMAAGCVDYHLISVLVEYIISSTDVPAGILIFLPGVQEIRECITAISNVVAKNNVDIYPLHAKLTTREQRAVFETSEKWKIIAATNVAETSITIDDVIYVIDAGKVKEISHNLGTGVSTLKEQWVSRAAARQRRGRAGRTNPGVCYKLYTRKQEEAMSPFPTPEILRIPLERISLVVKAMREDEDVQHFLERAIDPPNVSAMDKAWLSLQELGAIDKENKLTALGRHLARLPLDPWLGKMLVLGLVLRCLSPVLTLVASLSSKPLFVSPFEMREAANRAKSRFNKDDSDLLADVRAYNEYVQLQSEKKSWSTLRGFCVENFIAMDAIRDITSLRQDIFSSLSDMGLTAGSSTPDSPSLNVNSTNTNLIKAIIVAGLWPRVGQIHPPTPANKRDKVHAGNTQRENAARKIIDSRKQRVFLHSSSVLSSKSDWKSPFVAYSDMHQTAKVFVRGATEVSTYALLLFGGAVSISHANGGLIVGNENSGTFELRALPRTGTLINQLRWVFEAQLQQCIEQGLILGSEQDSSVLNAITALLEQEQPTTGVANDG